MKKTFKATEVQKKKDLNKWKDIYDIRLKGFIKMWFSLNYLYM